jgi:hypothetical protein
MARPEIRALQSVTEETGFALRERMAEGAHGSGWTRTAW